MMRVTSMVLYMFWVSVLLGTFLTGMTPLLASAQHYTISWTRVLMAVYMAAWMGGAEIVMSARMTAGGWTRVHTRLAVGMALAGLGSLAALRAQLFVTEAAWAARMVEHHSTALTTSSKLLARCAGSNATLCALADSILATQQEELAVLLSAAPVVSVSVRTGLAVALVALPAAGFQLRR
jgi:hypothetical protein